MGKIKDITGQRFGKLTVIEMTNERRNRQIVWKCQCDCGNITYVTGGSLRSGHTSSCGCTHYQKKAEDLSGKKFGKLTVLHRNYTKECIDRKVFWDCQCECGNLRIVSGTNLRTGKVTSCYNCNKQVKLIQYKGLGPIKDHTNERFGSLVVLELTDKRTPSGKAIWKCQCDCGNICYIDSNSLVSHNTTSCGCQKKSVGEEIIMKILKQNNIKYQRQYSFDDCISPKNSKLLFDFAIFDNNNNLKYIIEYDGIQHFKSIDYFGGEQEFNYRKLCDNIKNDYCNQHNISIIRIPYTERNKITIKDLII